jgi:cell division protein FtsB
MTGFIFLLILILLAAFIILVVILYRTSEQQKLTESLYDRVKYLSEDIAKLTKEVRNLKQPVETKNTIVEEKSVQKTFVAPPIVTPKEEKKEG